MPGLQSLLMSKIMEYLIRDFLEEEVKIEVIGGSFKVFTHEGLIDLVRGAEYNVPRWIAYYLKNEGIITVKGDSIEIDKLSSIAYNEESTISRPQFVKVPRYFYLTIKQEIEDIRDKLKEKADIELLQELKTYEDLLYTVGKARLKKLLYLLLLKEIPQDILEKLSEEEKIVLNTMKDTLNIWMKSLRIEKH